ncbi:MAG: hypothetical protein IJQ42_02280 [Oscillospiraceae bacterium]|nr:hypothetical protein [Oscillospiraceae bacterium]
MIPIPTHLREMAENADGHGEKLRFFLRCPCGETLFTLEESDLSPKEKAAERAHEKAVKTLFSDCPYGLSLTYDGENFHYWKHLSEAKENGEKEEIPVPPGPQFTLHTVVRCRCSSCGRSSVLFDSRLHGYDAVTAEEPEAAQEDALFFRQRTKNPVRLQIEIENDPDLDTFRANTGLDFDEEQYADAFSWITIRSVSPLGKKKVLFEYETA